MNVKEGKRKKMRRDEQRPWNTFTALKNSLSDSVAELVTGADKIADIIVDDSEKGRKTRARRLGQESVSMVKDIARRIKEDMQGASLAAVVRDASYEAGKLSRMIKDTVCEICG